MKLRPDVFEVSRRLVKRGHKVVVLTSKAYGAPSYEVIEDVEVYRVPVFTFPNIFYFIPFFPLLISKLLKICRKHKIEILHFWCYEYPNSILAPFMRKRLANLPFVLTVISFPGLNWRYGTKIVDVIALIYTQTVGRLIIRCMDHVVVLGKSLIKYAKWMGVPEDKLSICPLGIDVNSFIPKKSVRVVREEFGISISDTMIIYVGRLAKVKGVVYLLKAARHLCNRSKNIKFLIVGDGPLRSSLEKFSNNQTIFAGWRNDVADLLNASDALVLPSLSEGLPMSMLEAYAIGKPVIATNVGAIEDVVINGETGLLVQPGDWKKLADALWYLIENQNMRRKMGMKGKDHVMKYYRWERHVIDEYERIYGLSRIA